jgi:hypothetical protein
MSDRDANTDDGTAIQRIRYKAFGLTIDSKIAIPQFEPAQSSITADVAILEQHLARNEPPAFDGARLVAENSFELLWRALGTFAIKGGKTITVFPNEGVEDEMIRLPLIGVAMAALLHQRGSLVLHGSGVSIGGKAALFLGWKGAGKSTTAAAMWHRGYPMISDDILSIDGSTDGTQMVAPGFPSFKLNPESVVSVLNEKPEDLSVVCSGVEKRYRSFAGNFIGGSTEIGAIFALCDGDQLNAEVMGLQDALGILIANTYLARYGNDLMPSHFAASHLRKCVDLISRVPVYRLTRPRDFGQIDALTKLVGSLLRPDDQSSPGRNTGNTAAMH